MKTGDITIRLYNVLYNLFFELSYVMLEFV